MLIGCLKASTITFPKCGHLCTSPSHPRDRGDGCLPSRDTNVILQVPLPLFLHLQKTGFFGTLTSKSMAHTPLADILSHSPEARAQAERQAVNTTVQGSAAYVGAGSWSVCFPYRSVTPSVPITATLSSLQCYSLQNIHY